MSYSGTIWRGLALAALVAGGLTLGWLPARREIDRARLAQAALDARLTRSWELVREIPRWREREATLTATQQRLWAQLHTPDGAGELVRELAGLAAAQGLRVLDARVSPAELLEAARETEAGTGPPVRPVPFGLTVEGDYARVITLAESLAARPGFRSFLSAEISRGEAGGSVRAALVISHYLVSGSELAEKPDA